MFKWQCYKSSFCRKECDQFDLNKPDFSVLEQLGADIQEYEVQFWLFCLVAEVSNPGFEKKKPKVSNVQVFDRVLIKEKLCLFH